MGNKDKIILDLCGGTGEWNRPYVDAGYDVRLLTLPTCDVRQLAADKELFNIPLYKVYGVLAAPPCTMFSRARTTAKEPRDFEGAMSIVKACLDIIWRVQYKNRFGLKFWVLENPAGHLQRFLGRPAFKFQPYDFGDRYSKETWLWGYFNEPKKNPISLNQQELYQSRVNTRPLPKIDGIKLTTAERRAITPAGFARAFFKVNQ